MKLQRFFIKDAIIEGVEVSMSDADFVHQIFHVFRKKIGDQIVLLDNSGFEFLSEIVFLNKKEVNIKILNKKEVLNIPTNKVTLFASMIKKDKFEWVLEKCTELGVNSFVPVISERVEKKDLNIERAEKILKEASEQSERGFIPDICEPISLSEALENLNTNAIAFHLEGGRFDGGGKNLKGLAIFIGPEGGWGEKDMDLFKKYNVKIVTLGSQVLRAETASMAVCAKILL